MKFFWEAFVTLFVITDPPGIVPLFLGLTRGRPAAVRARLAWEAAVVAFGVIVVFALFGRQILVYLQVGLPALQAAGGLLLLLVSLELLTGHSEEPTSLQRARANVAFVPLGTPLLAGPGAIVATMLFVQRVHGVANGIALAAALAGVAISAWLAMRFAGVIHRVLTDNGVELLTRIAGLFLSAIAVQLVAEAAKAFAQSLRPARLTSVPHVERALPMTTRRFRNLQTPNGVVEVMVSYSTRSFRDAKTKGADGGAAIGSRGPDCPLLSAPRAKVASAD